jgi:hypothetical protein
VIYEHDCITWHKKDSIYKILDDTLSGKSNLLSGRFYQKNEEGNITGEEIYTAGLPIYWKMTYYNRKGIYNSSETIYYDSLWHNIEGTFKYQHNYEEYASYNCYREWTTYKEYDTINTLKHPYFKDIPPLIGITAGYNFIQNKQLEFGVL